MVALPNLIPGIRGVAGGAALALAVVAQVKNQADVQIGDELVVFIGEPRQIGRAVHLARGNTVAVSGDVAADVAEIMASREVQDAGVDQRGFE